MERPELAKTSSARKDTRPLFVPRYLLIATWAMSRREPNLFYWRDPSSYDNDPYITVSVEPPEQKINAAARAAVIDSLITAGIENNRAQNAIKGIQQDGAITIWDSYFDKETANLVPFRRRASMVFVEAIPSVLTELTKRDPHLLLPVSVIHPYSRWNSSLERRVEATFKKFVAQK